MVKTELVKTSLGVWSVQPGRSTGQKPSSVSLYLISLHVSQEPNTKGSRGRG